MRSILITALAVMFFTTSPSMAEDATTRMLAGNCLVCHGPEGKSVGAIPSLNVLTPQQIESAVAQYASGERPSTIMNTIARGFSPERVKAIAAFLGRKEGEQK